VEQHHLKGRKCVMRDNWESIQRSCMDRSVVTKVVEISYSDQKIHAWVRELWKEVMPG